MTKHFRFSVSEEVAAKFVAFVMKEAALRGKRLSQEILFSEWIEAGCPLQKQSEPIVPHAVQAQLTEVAQRPGPEKLHRAAP